MKGSSTFSFHKTIAFLYDTTFPITYIIQLVGFCTAIPVNSVSVGAIPLFKFGKKTTNSKFGEACLLPLIVRELKEQQFYMTNLLCLICWLLEFNLEIRSEVQEELP